MQMNSLTFFAETANLFLVVRLRSAQLALPCDEVRAGVRACASDGWQVSLRREAHGWGLPPPTGLGRGEG